MYVVLTVEKWAAENDLQQIRKLNEIVTYCSL